MPAIQKYLPRMAGRWWIAWATLTAIASVTPFFHDYWGIGELTGRYHSWGLIPAHWLVFRWFGELSTSLLVGMFGIGVLAWFRPSNGPPLIVGASFLITLLSILYASYCGILISGMIAQDVEDLEFRYQHGTLNEKSGKAEQTGDNL